MPHPAMDNGVVSLLRDPADSTIQVTDEGIFPMKAHRWILPVAIQTRTVPVEGLPGALRTDPLLRAARGTVILALVLGSLGADAAASSGYGSADHASARKPAANISLAASASSRVTNRPWMY